MDSLATYFTNTELGCNLKIYNINNNIWCKGGNISDILGYANSRQAIATHVDDEDKMTLGELLATVEPKALPPSNCLFLNDGDELDEAEASKNRRLTFNETNTIYINESGLWSLICASNKKNPMAYSIKRWITNEVLPSIRKTGGYSTKPVYDSINPFNLKNEDELEFVFNYLIKKHYPDVPVSVGCGDFFRYFKEGKKAGYQRGCPDLTFNVKNAHYSALMIELKNPITGGQISEQQKQYQALAESYDMKYICSPDLVDVIRTTDDYMKTVQKPKCPFCKKPFKDMEAIRKHSIFIHKKDNITRKTVVLPQRGEEYKDNRKYFIKNLELFMIEKIMHKSYHCLRCGIHRPKKADVGDEERIIRYFNINKIKNRAKWIPKEEIEMDKLMTAEEAAKRFEFKKVATYSYVQS